MVTAVPMASAAFCLERFPHLALELFPTLPGFLFAEQYETKERASELKAFGNQLERRIRERRRAHEQKIRHVAHRDGSAILASVLMFAPMSRGRGAMHLRLGARRGRMHLGRRVFRMRLVMSIVRVFDVGHVRQFHGGGWGVDGSRRNGFGAVRKLCLFSKSRFDHLAILQSTGAAYIETESLQIFVRYQYFLLASRARYINTIGMAVNARAATGQRSE